MSKKILCMLLCAAMCVGVFAACGNGVDEDPNAFTVFVPHAVPDGYTSYNELPVYKELEKRTGMKVKYVHGEYSEINNMFGGEYYDVMMMSDVQVGGSYSGGQEKGVSDGLFWDLTEYIDEYGKDYLNVIESSYSSVQKATVTDSGKRIGIYNVPLAEQGPWYGFVMREDWLRKHQESAGIIETGAAVKQPQTYDEWEAFLTYAKANCTKDNAAPLFLYYTGVDMVGTLNAGFGVSSELYLKNGTEVAYGAVESEYKQYLDKMKDWYSKGLIDTGFAENNTGTESMMPFATAIDSFDQTTYAYNPAQYAAFPIIYTYISTYEKAMANYAPLYEVTKRPQYALMPVAAPKQNASDELHIRYTEKAPGYVAVTNKVRSEEKVKNIVKWFNYLFTDEGMELMNYGIEGDTFEMVDGKPMFTEKITKAKDKNGKDISFADAISTYVTLNFVFGYDWERELQIVTDEEKSAMTDIWNCDSSYVLPTLSLTEVEGRVAEMYQGSAKTYKDEFTVKYIKGTNDISFDTFKNNMKTTYKVDELIRVNTAAYERYKTRGGN